MIAVGLALLHIKTLSNRIWENATKLKGYYVYISLDCFCYIKTFGEKYQSSVQKSSQVPSVNCGCVLCDNYVTEHLSSWQVMKLVKSEMCVCEEGGDSRERDSDEDRLSDREWRQTDRQANRRTGRQAGRKDCYRCLNLNFWRAFKRRVLKGTKQRELVLYISRTVAMAFV